MQSIIQVLKQHQKDFHPVVPFDPATEKIASLDLTRANQELTEEIYSDTKTFSVFIDQKRNNEGVKFLIGGYSELREMYKRSLLFDFEKKYAVENTVSQEPRRLHLGTDIWGEAGTRISVPFGGMIHSFANNNNFGDYGATIILQHQLGTINFYTLYGHLSAADIKKTRKGQYLTRGQVFAHFGEPKENGNWPPHLHFQIIVDIGLYEGDYPGVCKYSEREKYLSNSPDADLILQIDRFAGKSGST